jgi:hypothetical protein
MLNTVYPHFIHGEDSTLVGSSGFKDAVGCDYDGTWKSGKLKLLCLPGGAIISHKMLEFLQFGVGVSWKHFSMRTGWFQPETEPRFAAKVVTWLASFLTIFKFIKMTAVHFQPPTDLLAAVEGRCIDLRSLLDLLSSQYILECNYRLVYLAPVEQFARNWPKEASISTLLFLSGRYYRTLWQHRRPLEGQRRGTRQRRPVLLTTDSLLVRPAFHRGASAPPLNHRYWPSVRWAEIIPFVLDTAPSICFIVCRPWLPSLPSVDATITPWMPKLSSTHLP